MGLTTRDGSPPRIYSLSNLPAVELVSFPGGSTAVFTTRSPAKSTPNEDAVALIPAGDDAGVLVVADGLGGLPAGAEAARIAVTTLAETIAAAVADQSPLREAILDAIDQANDRILKTATGSATTLAVVEMQHRTIRSYHIGDSVIMLVGQRGKIKLQTVPHSPVGYAVESGFLDEDAAVHHQERNIVSNVLGMSDMRIDIGPTLKLAPRDTLLLASDGLVDNLYTSEIIETIRKGDLAPAAQTLVDRCQERMRHYENGQPHHPDDLSFILYRPLACG